MELYRISKYAKLMNVSYECVRKWIKAGKVKTQVIDNTTFVVKED